MGKQSDKKRPPPTHGEINLSQTVSTYGIGSVCELRAFRGSSAGLNSAMILGLDWWDTKRLRKISEPTLAKSLGVRDLLEAPIVTDDKTETWEAVPAVRFPRYLVCSACERLGVVGKEFDGTGMGRPKCADQKCRGHGVPARLVVACFHSPKDGDEDLQPGHIDDFPWKWWAFSEHMGPKCKSPQLYLRALGTTSSLAGLRVECRCPECKGSVGRTLEHVFGENALTQLTCFGIRPWLNDEQPGCSRKIRALLRGASNVFFHVTASAISIPPYSEALVQLIAERCEALIAQIGTQPIASVIQMVKNFIPYIGDKYTDEQIGSALALLGDGNSVPFVQSDLEQRVLERTALREGRPEEDGGRSEFVAQIVSQDRLERAPMLARYLGTLVEVSRLREVRVFRGFTRINSPQGTDAYRTRCAPVARQKLDWLPAFEVRGEGIYVELAETKVASWEGRPAVVRRIGLLRQNLQRIRKELGQPVAEDDELPTARFVLVHSLAHLLMKQLSLECGYSSASLRERLYVFNGAGDSRTGNEKSASVLIYTATADADGTLGGLVRQGDPERLEKMLWSALEGARWCSSDPLCMESTGQGSDARNLAACHACCLLSETSCENCNRDLDRALLVGIRGEPDLAFFEDMQCTDALASTAHDGA